MNWGLIIRIGRQILIWKIIPFHMKQKPLPRRTKSSVPKPRPRVRPRSMGIEWYDGTHYRRGQPFETFLNSSHAPTDERRMHVVTSLIHQLVNPTKSSALEIGPGKKPVLSGIGFAKTVFLEQSPVILRRLLRQKENRAAHGIVGDVRALPFHGKFGIVVMNEVLTHIQPIRRLEVIEQLSKRADSLLIIDRPQISINDLVLQYLKKGQEPPSSTNLHRAHITMVDFSILEKFLHRIGWDVQQIQTQPQNWEMWDYRILIAKKK